MRAIISCTSVRLGALNGQHDRATRAAAWAPQGPQPQLFLLGATISRALEVFFNKHVTQAMMRERFTPD